MWGRSATPPPTFATPYYSASEAAATAKRAADERQEILTADMFQSIRWKASVGGTHTTFRKMDLPRDYQQLLISAGYTILPPAFAESRYVVVKWSKQES